LARIIRIFNCILCQSLSLRFPQILIETKYKSFGIINIISINDFISIVHRSFDVVVKIHNTISWSFASLVFYYCIWKRIYPLFINYSFHCIVKCFEAKIFHLILFSKVAHCSNVIYSSRLLKTYSQLLKWLNSYSKTLTSQPKEVLLLSLILIDHELENIFISKRKVFL
jgi:hypothetical protein